MMRTRTCAASFGTSARAVADRIHSRRKNPPFKPKPVTSLPAQPATVSSTGVSVRRMESPFAREQLMPLSAVVTDCVRRWFQDTLKAALAGDVSMQIILAQMYRSGYGVAKDELKAKKWIKEASKYRSSAWRYSNKHPAYNSGDSDSDKVEGSGKQ